MGLPSTTLLQMPSARDRALGTSVWGRKAAQLPDFGVLIVATDLQGNRADYEALKALYFDEKLAGNEPMLAFCGDMVHGPSPDLNEPGAWPPYLGAPYEDESASLILDFERFTRHERAFSLIGNHEHAHIGGPIVAKFYDDEAAVLDRALGRNVASIHSFFRTWPLIAVAPCGLVLTHGAPMATEKDLTSFEDLDYEGHNRVPIWRMLEESTVGALLWSRSAAQEQAEALLQVAHRARQPRGFVVYGHDIVPEGIEVIDKRQVCLSTSFGLHDQCKTYLRIELGRRYESALDLRQGVEIRPLYT